MATVTRRAKANGRLTPPKPQVELPRCRQCNEPISDEALCPRGLCLCCDPQLAEAMTRGVGYEERRGEGRGTRDEGRLEQGPDGAWLVPVDLIDPSPYQPRRHFDQVALDALAESIKRVGLAQPILVRPMQGGGWRREAGGQRPGLPSPDSSLQPRFELVAGERRLRAVKAVGWTHIQATVCEMTDTQARDLCLVENAQREDLDPIEQARAWQAWLAVGEGRTQRELAELVGCDQSVISLAVRLVELPHEPWQEWLIARAITPAHARHVLPYAGYPAILRELERGLAAALADGTPPGVREWEGQVTAAVMRHSAPCKKYVSGKSESGEWVSGQVQLTASGPHEDLAIVEVTRFGQRERRALNQPAAKKALREQEQKWQERRKIVSDRSRGSRKAAAGTGDTEKPPTPAQLRAAAKQRATERQGALAEVAETWLAWLCRRELTCGLVGYGLRAVDERQQQLRSIARRLILLRGWEYCNSWGDVLAPLIDADRHCGWKAWPKLPGTDEHLARLETAVAGDLLCEVGEGGDPINTSLAGSIVAAIARELAIDPAAAWREAVALGEPGRQAFAGPLTERVIACWAAEDLGELHAEWKLGFAWEPPAKDPHEEFLRRVRGQHRTFPMPREFAQAVKAGLKGRRR